MRYEADISSASSVRPTGRSMLRGWRRRCPNCGGGPMLDGYLSVRSKCASCSETLSHHRADDMPAWATILIVGKLIIFALVTVEVTWAPPSWVHWTLWPVLTLAMTLWLLPRIKGVIVALQWAWRMHGFDDDPGR